KKNITLIRRDCRLNLALSLVDACLLSEAAPILEELHREDPDNRCTLMLAQTYVQLRRFVEARQLLEPMVSRINSNGSATGSNDSNEPAKRNGYSLISNVHLLMGVLEFEEGNIDEALVHLHRAEEVDATTPILHI